jgi:sugar (pentulose or hexulose) kinase
MRATGRPMSWAASSLPPIANPACPKLVWLSTTSPTRKAASANTTGSPRPRGDGFAYVSSGTWSLVGVETPGPIRTQAARAAGLTNEHGVAGTNRLLKNVTGLWLLQAYGAQASLAELRDLVRRSTAPRCYEPREPEAWSDALDRFERLLS